MGTGCCGFQAVAKGRRGSQSHRCGGPAVRGLAPSRRLLCWDTLVTEWVRLTRDLPTSRNSPCSEVRGKTARGPQPPGTSVLGLSVAQETQGLSGNTVCGLPLLEGAHTWCTCVAHRVGWGPQPPAQAGPVHGCLLWAVPAPRNVCRLHHRCWLVLQSPVPGAPARPPRHGSVAAGLPVSRETRDTGFTTGPLPPGVEAFAFLGEFQE